MAKAADRTAFLLLALLIPVLAAAQPILERTVQVDAQRVHLSEALSLIARDGKFKLSYNAAAVNGDSIVHVAVHGTVEAALRSLVGPRFELKETGSHIILLDKGGARRKFIITGAIYDAKTGGPVAQASVHEVDGKSATSTDGLGTFKLEVSGERDRTAILVMRREYHDTVVYVGRDGVLPRLPLHKRATLEQVQPICLYDRCGVEDLGVARLLVPNSQFNLASNLDIEERRVWQISVIPTVSSNGDMAPVAVNNVSLNVLAGYSRGLNGFEVGVANMESHDVKGMQIAGLTNLVGRNTNGVQVAGAINHTMRTLEGVQVAGLGNTVWDEMNGVQIAGGANVVKGRLKGVQISGGCNVATQDVDGTQITGGVNVTPKNVQKAQIAGAANFGHKVMGAQVAGGVNVALDSVGGGQVGFGLNYAGSVSGGQFSFGMNVVPGHVSGGQVGFGLNYAGSVSGGQFSFGTNVVPGHVSGGQVGFGLNYAGSVSGGQFSFGMNVVRGTVVAGQVGFGLNYAQNVTEGQFSFGANVVPGTVEGGQVGALNFALKALGGQVGIINISDTVGGFAVGLLTISRKGYHRTDLVTGDVMQASVQLRTGTRVFHNILGYSPAVEPNGRWGFLYGFGFEPRFGRVVVNIDLTGEQIVEQEEWVDAVNILGRFSIAPGVQLFDRVFLFAGPVLNMLATDWRDADTGAYLSALPPAQPPYQWRSGTTTFHGWWGWKAGVGVRF
ncbi:MAG: hypothetical protein KF797_13515 [Flavobacteriales bacterium]|nr:hypothetical protein [Flavobacteriales bacterium]